MLNTIVWATDGSEHANRALEFAKTLLPEGGMLIAVHIVQDPPPHTREQDPAATRQSPGLVTGLRKLVAEISEEGLDVALKVADHLGPQPARAIAQIAREVDADAIVVGTRGYSPIHGLFVGSVTQTLLHTAPCPVIAVPPLPETANDRGEIPGARATG